MAAEAERGRAAGYQRGPPWVFKGSALYQLHLVKASTARAFVPPELRLVEAFGYTLGGMFLARYHDSPAGEFDEVGCPSAGEQRRSLPARPQGSRAAKPCCDILKAYLE